MNFVQRLNAFAAFGFHSTLRALALDADLIFATSTPLTIAIPAMIASRFRRIPMVFEVRDLWPGVPIAVGALNNRLLKFGALWLERAAYASSSAVVALSPGMAEGVARRHFPVEKILIAPNACDLEAFAPDCEQIRAFRDSHAWLGARPLVLYAGTLGRVNDVSWLVDVARVVLLRNSEVRFLVVGDGMDRSKIAMKARDCGVLDKNFFMLPGIAKCEIPAVIGSADLSLSLFIPLPALEANSANKFFDTLAAGRPIAVNYGGWQAQIIKESGAGIVLERNSARAAEQILKFVCSPDLVKKCGDAAFQLARNRFSRDEVVGTIVDLMEAVHGEAMRRRN